MSEAPTASPTAAGTPAAPPRSWYSARPDVLPVRQMQWLRQRHVDYARQVADWFTLQLRMDFTLQVKPPALQPVAEFLEAIPEPTHLLLFKLTPNGRTVYLNLPCPLGMALVDRWLGGPGSAEPAERALSDLEAGLLEPAVQMFLEKWVQFWGNGRGWTATPVGREYSTRFLQVRDPGEMVCALNFEAVFGEVTAPLTLAVPMTLIRELLPAQGPAREAAPTPAPGKTPAWNPLLEEVIVRLTAEWIGLEMTARDLAALKPGDYLHWEGGAGGQVKLRIGPRVLFAGRPGTQNRRWAVQITERVAQ